MSVSPRVTIRDIAERANLHFTTVSLALRNSPRLKADTREKIQKLAESMGYRPDPMLAALNAYRQSRQPVHFQAALAWIHNWDDPKNLYHCDEFRLYFLGAKERAHARGYNLEEFWLKEPGMNIERLHRILRARNIVGALLAPQPAANTFLDLKYGELAAVAFGYSMQPAVLDLITNHHPHTMSLLLEKMFALGYRRIGLCVPREWDHKVDRAWQSCMLLAQSERPELAGIPIFWNVWDETRPERILAWIRTHRLDAIVSHNEILPVLQKGGTRIPADLGFASLFVGEDDAQLSGVHQNDRLIGRKAVDMVIDMLHRGETGVPETPVRMLVEGRWNPGRTLVAQHPSPKKTRPSRRRAKVQVARS